MAKKNHAENVHIDHLFRERNLGADKGLFTFKALKISNNHTSTTLGEIPKDKIPTRQQMLSLRDHSRSSPSVPQQERGHNIHHQH